MLNVETCMAGQLIRLPSGKAISLSVVSRIIGTIFLMLLAEASSADRAVAHEVWIEPNTTHLPEGEQLLADLRIGDMFKGDHLIYIPQQTERLFVLTEAGSFDLEPRIGSRPVVTVPPGRLAGLAGEVVVVYQSANNYIHYGSEGKFFRFAEKKGVPDVRQTHAGRQLPQSGFVERYKRFAKASIDVGPDRHAGSQQVNDRAVGMELEFVSRAKAHLLDGRTALEVQLMYQGNVLPAALVTLFSRDPEGRVTASQHTTDGQGTVRLMADPGHRYLLDHVTLRETDPAKDRNRPVWESLWASLTFAGTADRPRNSAGD